MYLIKTKFIGKDGTFTKEEESATTECWRDIKYKSSIEKWFHIICRHTDSTILFNTRYGYEELDSIRETKCDMFLFESNYLLKFMQNYISFLNNDDGKNRSFTIEIEEIPDEIAN